MNVIVSTNHKPTLDTQKTKIQEPKNNTKENNQATKKRLKEERTTKTKTKKKQKTNNEMVKIHSYK